MKRFIPLISLLLGCAALQPGQAPENQYRQLAPNVWMHTSYRRFIGLGAFPSNGLIVKTKEGLVLIDTAWNNAQTQDVLQWARANLGAPVTDAVMTHAHVDKMGGAATLRQAKVRTWAHALSNQDAPGRGLTPAERALDLQVGGARSLREGVEVFYPGPGHTRDNVVVYLEGSKILFGGCLIRPGASNDLGNTADADLSRWAQTVRAVKARYPQAKIVVPSHGPPAGPGLLEHTIQLAQKR